ncbi:MAG: TerD family protein [Betaproteobacteria bacterium]
MPINEDVALQGDGQADAVPALKEVVMGLHWDPPADGITADSADLDAVCVLFDAQGCVLEVIHAGHLRNADGSIIHTGDSRTGASAWDDERIFVFLEALPAAVSALTFLVISATGCALHEVRGAFCHISDRGSEYLWVRRELATLAGCSVYAVATLHRGVAGWSIATDVQPIQSTLITDLLSLVSRVKSGAVTTTG